MTKIKIYIFSLLTLVTLQSSVLADNPQQTVFSVVTYKTDGSVIGKGYGFFIQNATTGIAAYNLFKGAARAEVTDCKGRTLAVIRILGANSSYDLIKFQIEEGRNNSFLNCNDTGGQKGETFQVFNYSTEKKNYPTNIKVERADDYGSYKYYYITIPNIEKNFGCPVVNADGNVVAIIQKNVLKNSKTACAIDARFAADLTINSTSSLNSDLQAITIPKALPQNEIEALSFIYMMNPDDSLAVMTALDDFIIAYPNNAEGYVNRATFYASHGRYDESDQDFSTAFIKASYEKSTMKADAVHYSFSKLLYNYSLQNNMPVIEGWNMNRALSEAIAAQEESPNPLYKLQQGDCEYALTLYPAAVESYRKVCNSDIASPQTFYKTAQAMEKAGMPRSEILVQLDSAVSHLSKPYIASEAYYLYIRATQEIALGKYREAAIDLTDYEQAVGAGSLTHTFFADRSATERKAKMFQQALDDIRLAQTKAQAPQVYFYRLEEASIMLQVGMFDEAINKANLLLEELAENPDCYKIIGIAYGEKKMRKEALKNLQKAKELGDETTDSLMEKYKNK